MLDGIAISGPPAEVVVLPAAASDPSQCALLVSTSTDGKVCGGSSLPPLPPPTIECMGACVHLHSSCLQLVPPALNNRSFDMIATAGDMSSFVIAARDEYGNQRDGGGDSFYALASSVSEWERQKDGARSDMQDARKLGLSTRSDDWLEVVDRGDGTYHVRFVRSVAGAYELRAWLHGEPVPSTLLCRVSPGSLCLDQCTTQGAGVRFASAGTSTEVWIEARDSCGNLVGVGGERWHVRIEAEAAEAASTRGAAAAASAALHVRDCGDSRYCVSYLVARAGLYALHISHVATEGVTSCSLVGSPFELHVLPSAFDSSCIECTTDLQAPLSVLAGQASWPLCPTDDSLRLLPPTVSYCLYSFRLQVSKLRFRVKSYGGFPLDDTAEYALLHQLGVTFAAEAPTLPRLALAAGLHGGAPWANADGAIPAGVQLIGVSVSAGQCTVCFLPTKSGEGLKMNVTLGASPLPNSPYRLRVLPAPTHTSNCVLRVAPLTKEAAEGLHNLAIGSDGASRTRRISSAAMAGLPFGVEYLGAPRAEAVAGIICEVWLHAMDRFGNRQEVGGDPFIARLGVRPTVQGQTGTGRMAHFLSQDEKHPSVIDRGDGTYHVRFVRNIAGMYELCAWLRGEPVPSTLLCRVSPGSLCLDRCTTQGAGVGFTSAGTSTEVWIEARDSCGNLVGVGGERWHVRIEAEAAEAASTRGAAAAASAALHVRDCGDSRYCVSYLVARAGLYALHISHVAAEGVTGCSLVGSPFELLVRPSAADPSCALLPGWEDCTAGEPAAAKLFIKPFGNLALLTAHVDRLSACIRLKTGTIMAHVPLTAASDGTGCELRFVVTRARKDLCLEVLFDETPVTGSPFPFCVQPAQPSVIHSRLLPLGSIAAPDQPYPVLWGTHAATECETARVFVAGVRGWAQLQLLDAFSNAVTESAGAQAVQMVVERVDPPPSETMVDMCKVVDHGDGRYTASFLSGECGMYELRAWLRGEPVPSTLLCRVSPGSLCLDRCTTQGAGVGFTSAGTSTEVWIEARDSCGNLVGVGGERWHVRIEAEAAEAASTRGAAAAASAALHVRDCGDSRYCVSYLVARAGLYALHISHVATEGVTSCSLVGSPFELHVRPSTADPRSCAVLSDELARGAVIAGQVNVAWVLASDASGNQLLAPPLWEDLEAEVLRDGVQSGEGDSALLHSEALAAAFKLRPELSLHTMAAQSGTCLSFTASQEGTCELHVRMQGCHLRGSPFILRVHPGQTWPAHTKVVECVSAESGSSVLAGTRVSRVLRTHDRQGNPRHSGGDTVRLLLRGHPQPCVLEATVEDQGNGTYTLSFQAQEAGTLSAILGINGELVKIDGLVPSTVLRRA